MIAYVNQGTPATASLMNDLFNELDRKLGILLCGKSPYLLTPAWSDVEVAKAFGRRIVIAGEKRAYTLGLDVYDHAMYEQAVDAAAILDVDHDLEQVYVVDPKVDLDLSVEAHRKDIGDGRMYWVAIGTPDDHLRPERIHRYAVLELLIEDVDHVLIPKKWNKYNYFRIHNIQPKPITVKFEGGPALSMDSYGCVTVRRDSVDGTYLIGRYFWPFQSGDPRLWNYGTMAATYPELSSQANNVCNPAIALFWIERLTSENRSSYGWELDPPDADSTPDMSAYHGIFANPSDPNVFLGDLRIHKGEVHLVDRTSGVITKHIWPGYGSAHEFGRDIVDVSVDGNGAVTVSPKNGSDIDLVTVGTNLLVADLRKPFAALPVSIASSISFAPAPWIPANKLESTVSNLWIDEDGVTRRVVSGSILSYSGNYAEMPLTFRSKDTVGHVTDQTGASILLTPHGPMIVGRYIIDDVLPGLNPNAIRFDNKSNQVYVPIAARMQLTGWPDASYMRAGFFGGPAPAMMLSPRVDRFYGNLLGGYRDYRSPDWKKDNEPGHGLDYDFDYAGADRKPIRILQSIIPSGPIAGIGRTVDVDSVDPIGYWFLPPDSLDDYLTFSVDDYTDYAAFREKYMEGSWSLDSMGWLVFRRRARFLRPPLIADHYNHIAWLLNRIRRIRTIRIIDIIVPDGIGGTARLGQNNLGLRAGSNWTSIRPSTQFARVISGDANEVAAGFFGLRIRDADDLPASYFTAAQTARSGGENLWHWIIRREVSKVSIEYGRDPIRRRIGWHIRTVKNATVDSTPIFVGWREKAADLDIDVYDDLTYRWIDVEDIMSLSQEIGIEWWQSDIAVPISIETHEANRPTMLPWNEMAWTETEVDWYDYETQEEAEAAAPSVGEVFIETVEYAEPAVYVRCVEVASESPEWVASAGWYIDSNADRRSDSLIVLEAPGSHRQTPLARLPSGHYVASGKPEEVKVRDAMERRRAIFQERAGAGAGWKSRSVALLVPSYVWSRVPEYASQSRSRADAWLHYGDNSRPVSLNQSTDYDVAKPSNGNIIGPTEKTPIGEVLFLADLAKDPES